MVLCKYCKLNMVNSDSCLKLHEKINGKTYRRLVDPNGSRCGDCGILNADGNAHHPGCCMEQCPVCSGQAMCCDCTHGNMW